MEITKSNIVGAKLCFCPLKCNGQIHRSAPTFSIISLGCFRNTYDSESIGTRFLKQGFTLKDKLSSRHTLIVNTCGFIDKAKEESLEAIRQAIHLKKKNKAMAIIIAGCLVERYKEELKKSFPEVDAWLGITPFASEVRQVKITPFFIDFLKISEGCLNNCSFCAIPLIKGPLCSRPKKEIIQEAQSLDQKKIKELNIIGQDITSWAKDLKDNENLTSLLETLLKATKNIKWIRLIYTHPKNFSSSLINLIAHEERICKYIDLPIQHINDRILKLMRRGVTKNEIISLIEKIRKKIPGCAIRTSLIVGFPGESEKDFKELLDFIGEIKFERLGAFIYSREEGTLAYGLSGQITHQTKKSRFKELMQKQQEISRQFNEKLIGRKLDVLIEKKEGRLFNGRTQYDAYEVDGAVFINKGNLKIGQFYRAKIVDAYEYDLIAK